MIHEERVRTASAAAAEADLYGQGPRRGVASRLT